MPIRPCASSIFIRPSRLPDLKAVTAIYGQHVCDGTASFETEPPTLEEMMARREDVLSKGLPYLVATRGDEVLGFAYANWFKPRAAYRFCVENSIYLRFDASGQGLGTVLLAELLTQLERVGVRNVMALIGGADNLASIGLHSRLGFVRVGLVQNAGWKHGRWLDLILMQRALGLGATTNPSVK